MSSDSNKKIMSGFEHFMKFVPLNAQCQINITFELPPCPAARASRARCRSKVRSCSQSKSTRGSKKSCSLSRSLSRGQKKKASTKAHKETRSGSERSVDIPDDSMRHKKNSMIEENKKLKLKAKKKSDTSLVSVSSTESLSAYSSSLITDNMFPRAVMVSQKCTRCCDPFFPPATLLKGSDEKSENQKRK